jgi:hypothetical protein
MGGCHLIPEQGYLVAKQRFGCDYDQILRIPPMITPNNPTRQNKTVFAIQRFVNLVARQRNGVGSGAYRFSTGREVNGPMLGIFVIPQRNYSQ